MAIRDLGPLAKQWRDLEASGIPLEPNEHRVGLYARPSDGGLTVRIGRDSWQSQIWELHDGRFGYILPLFIRRDRPGKTIIRDCSIDPPWIDTIELLDDGPDGYSFTRGSEQFPRKMVLNHKIKCTLSRGDIREGLLLGVGLRPPEKHKGGDKISVGFTILSQWDRRHFVSLTMEMSRLAARAKTQGMWVCPPIESATRVSLAKEAPEITQGRRSSLASAQESASRESSFDAAQSG